MNAPTARAPRSPPDRLRTETVAFRCLPVARDQHVGDLLQLRLSDLIANLLHAVVEFDPEPGGGQLIADPPAYSRAGRKSA